MKTIFATLAVAMLSFTIATADEIDEKLENILYPCVRVLNGNGGGSGTVVYSEDREKDDTFETYVLTNWHVISNLIRVEKKWDNLSRTYRYVENNEQADVELFSYADGGATITRSSVKANIVAYVKDEDIALLHLDHPFEVSFAVKILPADKKLRLFQEIYAVGCPLLVDPRVSVGIITDLKTAIDKKNYIGGTAQIIWGNSGGAVMSKFGDEWFFCGIPSRGNVAGNGQFVSYMGYYVSPLRIRAFAKTQKLLFLIDDEATPTESLAEREKAANEATRVSPEGPSSADDYRFEQNNGDNYRSF